MDLNGQYSRGEEAPEIPPYLVVKLKRGWKYNFQEKVMWKHDGEPFSPLDDLPERAEIVYMVQDLAEVDFVDMSEDEEVLARYLHIIFPIGIEPVKYVPLIKEWECVDEVDLPPEVSLP